MASSFLRTAGLGLIVSIGLSTSSLCLLSQQPAGTPSRETQSAQNAPATVQPKTAQTRAQLRAQRRAHRLAARQTAVAPAQPPATSSTAAQRERDQKIFDQEKAQSAETARENDAVTRRQVSDQQRIQSEQRIQDAPGPGAQPLAGDPAVQPAQPTDLPRIQDAPGPAQTLPKAPPPAPAPQS